LEFTFGRVIVIIKNNEMADIEDIKKEYKELLDQLSDPELVSDFDRFEEISKRKKELNKIIEKQQELEDTQKRIKEGQLIISSEEPELADLAQAEIIELKEKEKELIKEVQTLLNNEGNAGP